jgi:hypothetical protein
VTSPGEPLVARPAAIPCRRGDGRGLWSRGHVPSPPRASFVPALEGRHSEVDNDKSGVELHLLAVAGSDRPNYLRAEVPRGQRGCFPLGWGVGTGAVAAPWALPAVHGPDAEGHCEKLLSVTGAL